MFERKYGITTREFLTNFNLRKWPRISDEDIFKWEVAVRRKQNERQSYRNIRINLAGRGTMAVTRKRWQTMLVTLERRMNGLR